MQPTLLVLDCQTASLGLGVVHPSLLGTVGVKCDPIYFYWIIMQPSLLRTVGLKYDPINFCSVVVRPSLLAFDCLIASVELSCNPVYLELLD